MGGADSVHWVMKSAYKIFIGKSEEKRPLGRPKRKWKDKIKIGIKEIVFDSVDWIHLAQDKDQWRTLMDTVVNLQVL
jgi:hypothetical protein